MAASFCRARFGPAFEEKEPLHKADTDPVEYA